MTLSLRLTHPVPSEAQVLRAVFHALTLHPKVSRVWRANTGAGKLVYSGGQSQFIRFGFKGQSDLLGFTHTGKFLAVEVKAPPTLPISAPFIHSGPVLSQNAAIWLGMRP